MDTDWCIVCDTKIVPHHSASCDSHENEDEIGDQAEQPTMTTAVSAFCSQDCLIKSYLEAAYQAHAYQHPEKTIGGLRRSNDSFMLHPGHSKNWRQEAKELSFTFRPIEKMSLRIQGEKRSSAASR